MINTEVTIKKATILDASVIAKISIETFIETFAAQNTKENMNLFLNECFNLEAVKSELLDDKTHIFMTFLKDELVAYTKIREETHSDFSSSKAIEIARIYVLKKYHSKKIGATLMKYIFDYAKQNKFEIVWLGVWEFNPKAIAFYKRWGFEVFGQHIFTLGTDDQNDLLMKKTII